MSGGGCCCGTRRDAGTFGRGPESLARLWERDGGERDGFSTVAVVVVVVVVVLLLLLVTKKEEEHGGGGAMKEAAVEAEVVVAVEAVVVSERFQLCVDLVVSAAAAVVAVCNAEWERLGRQERERDG